MADQIRTDDGPDELAYPDVTITDRWVAVQWHDRGPVLLIEEDGTVTERFTVPSDVAQLPLPATARPIITVNLPGNAA